MQAMATTTPRQGVNMLSQRRAFSFSFKAKVTFPRTNHQCITSCSVSGTDTIAAIVTGHQGAVAIVRISGPDSVTIARALFHSSRRRSSKEWIPESHRVVYGSVVDTNGATIDEVLVLPMLAPRSYTKEDVVELQCHGGDVCVRRVLKLCLEAGARLAQPGEFTLRAFLNGRIDLAQAENVAALVSARTVTAAETALAGLQGSLSSFIQSMRESCIRLLADIEAHIDFDEDLPPLDTEKVVQTVRHIGRKVNEALETSARGRLLQSGFKVAIVGRPNVGKSSLLNAWSQSEKAIVTDVPGTTRDIVEAEIVVGGVPVKLLDTAGMRDTDDAVEIIGVQRSEIASRGADVLVMVISACDGWTPRDSLIMERTELQKGTRPSLLVINKIDRVDRDLPKLPDDVKASFSSVVQTSALKKLGFETLERALTQAMGVGQAERSWAVNERQTEQLVRAKEALDRVLESAEEELPIDLWTVDLREAVIALGEITGEDVSEQVLSSIFSRFCIGK